MSWEDNSEKIPDDEIFRHLRFKLNKAGFGTVKELVMRGPVAISQATGIDFKVCEDIYKRASAMSREKGRFFATAADIHYHKSKNGNPKGISTGCKGIDDLFGGNGIEFGGVTQIYGEPGTGKTQLCHNLCGTFPSHSEAIFIDTEDTFQTERIKSIAKGRNLDYAQILDNIKVFQPQDSRDQEQSIINACQIISLNPSIKLLIVDSMMSFYKDDYPGLKYLAQRHQRIAKYAYRLRRTARQYNVAIVITNQIRTNPDRYESQSVTPIGGNALTYTCKHRIRFKRLLSNRFIGELDISYCYPYKQTHFTINEKGIADIEDFEDNGGVMPSCNDID